MIKRYGADTVRLFMLFAAPPERDLEWSDQGIEGCHRFLQRVYRLVTENLDNLVKVTPYSGEQKALSKGLQSLRRKTHQTIAKVTQDIEERYHFNTAIAAVMELTNLCQETLQKDPKEEHFWSVMREAVEAIILLLSPMAPHLSEELWSLLGHQRLVAETPWPSWDQEVAREDKVTIVVQVNGKLRDQLRVPASASEEEVRALALESPKVQKHLQNKEIKKVIFVPKRLINFVAK